MTGTSEGGKKAAAQQDMSEKGRKGAEALNADPQKKSAAAQKAADTLKRENPEHFREISREGGEGEKGGKSSGSSGSGSSGSSGSQSSQGGRGQTEEEEENG